MKLTVQICFIVLLFSSCQRFRQEADAIPPVGQVKTKTLLEKNYAYFKKLVEGSSATSLIYYKFAESAFLLNHNDEALKAINSGLGIVGNDADYSFLKSRILSSLNQKREAILEAENAAALALKTPEFYTFLASLYADVDSLRLANEYIEESLYMTPGWIPALQLKSNILLREGKPEEARAILVKTNELDAENIDTYDLLVKSYLQTPGRLDSAMAYNRKAQELKGSSAHVSLLHNTAKIMERLGKQDSAIRVYEDILKISHKGHIYGDLAELYFEADDFTKANINFQKQIEETPSVKMFYFRAGVCLEQLGRLNEVREIYLKGKQKFPKDSAFINAINRVTYRLDDKRHATEI